MAWSPDTYRQKKTRLYVLKSKVDNNLFALQWCGLGSENENDFEADSKRMFLT